jgi:hypothetical protein
LRFNWSIFSIVYIYWLELIIISTFQIFKILLSQGDPKKSFIKRTGIALEFFIVRSFVFFFYLVFIVVFLGFIVTGPEKTAGSGMAETVLFRNQFFNLTLLSFFLYNLLEFGVVFLATKQYKTTLPNDYFSVFDSHMIVVHIVVVLGTFLYDFVLKKMHANNRSAMIAVVCLFIVVKIIVDVVRTNMDKTPEGITGKYI